MSPLSRRRFLKITGAGASAAAAAGALGSLPGRLRASRGPVEKGVRTVPTFCDLCFWKCNAIATVRDGVLWKIEGNPDDPLSRGRLCPRGTGGVGAHFDTDRLRAPLLRASVRGEEKWTEVTWDEALGHVAEKLQKIKARVRAGGRRALQPRPRRELPQAHAEGVRLVERRGALVRAVPRSARRRLRADVRRVDRLAGAHRHRATPAASCSSARTSARTCTTPRCRSSPRPSGAARRSSSPTRASRSRRARRSTTCRSSRAPTSRSSSRG